MLVLGRLKQLTACSQRWYQPLKCRTMASSGHKFEPFPAWVPQPIRDGYVEQGVSGLFRWQLDVLSRNVDSGRNLVYSAPTSAGKSIVAELLALQVALTGKRVLFVLPYISVAREKLGYLQRLWRRVDVQVAGFIGANSAASRDWTAAVCTMEKASSLVNHAISDGTLEQYGMVVMDELHMVWDESRGGTLEALAAKLMCYSQGRPDVTPIRLIGMSATIPNLQEIGNWLRASIEETSFRPVVLCEHHSCDGVVRERVGGREIRRLDTRFRYPGDADCTVGFSVEGVIARKLTLVFCSSKNDVEKVALEVARVLDSEFKKSSELASLLSREALWSMKTELEKTSRELDQVLIKTLPRGVAYHHAGLTAEERECIENAFRCGTILVLVATSTLSSGVNLPAHRVIIKAQTRGPAALNSTSYGQMAGRAGRMGHAETGESIVVSRACDMPQVLRLMEAAPDRGGTLRRDPSKVILEGICSGLTPSLSSSGRLSSLLLSQSSKSTDQIVLDLASHSLITKNDEKEEEELENGDIGLSATQLGRAALASSLPPEAALFVFSDLQHATKALAIDTELHMLYLVTPVNCSVWQGCDWNHLHALFARLDPVSKRIAKMVGANERFLMGRLQGKSISPSDRQYQLHLRFFSSLALFDVIRESPIREVADKYRISRGALQSLQQQSATYAVMVVAFCGHLGWQYLRSLLEGFAERLAFGVRAELTELVRLEGMDGARARIFHEHDITSLAQLAQCTQKEVATVLSLAVPFESSNSNDGLCEWLYGEPRLSLKDAAATLIVRASKEIEERLRELGLALSVVRPAATVDTRAEKVTSSERSTSILEETVVESMEKDSTNSESDQVNHLTPPSSERDSQADLVDEESVGVTQPLLPPPSIERDSPESAPIEEEESLDATQPLLPAQSSLPSTPSAVSSGKHYTYSDTGLKQFDSGYSSAVPSTQGVPLVQLPYNTALSSTPLASSRGVAPRPSLSCSQIEMEDVDTDASQDLFSSMLELTLDERDDDVFRPLLANTSVCEERPDGAVDDLEKSLMMAVAPPPILNEDDVIGEDSADDIDGGSRTGQEKENQPLGNRLLDGASLQCDYDDSFDLPIQKELLAASPSPLARIDDSFDITFNPPTVRQPGASKTVPPSTTTTPLADRSLRVRSLLNVTVESLDAVPASPCSSAANLSRDLFDSPSAAPVAAPTPPPPAPAAQVAPKRQRQAQCWSPSIASPISKSCRLLIPPLPPSSAASSSSSGPAPSTSANQHRFPVSDVCASESSWLSFVERSSHWDAVAISLVQAKSGGVAGVCLCTEERQPDFVPLSDDYYPGSSAEESTCPSSTPSQSISIADRLDHLRLVLSRSRLLAYNILQLSEKLRASHGLNISRPICLAYTAFLAHLRQGDAPLPLAALICRFQWNFDIASLLRMNVRVRAAATVYVVARLHGRLSAQAISLSSERSFSLEQDSIGVVWSMTSHGFHFDRDLCSSALSAAREHMTSLERECHQLAGRAFNLDSAIMVSEVLFTRLRLPHPGGLSSSSTRRHLPTNRAVLEQMTSSHPIVSKILRFRKLQHAVSQCLVPLSGCVSSDGVIRTTFEICTATGRLLSHRPNIQNVPKERLFDEFCVRSLFRARPDYILLAADFCQLELRVLAHLSADPELIRRLSDPDRDIFSELSTQWAFPRDSVKQVCYAIIYGMGVKSLAETTKTTGEQAAKLMESFFRSFPKVKSYINNTKDTASARGFVSTFLGRRRIANCRGKQEERSRDDRQSVNFTIQGTASEIFKQALLRLQRRIREEDLDARIVMTVHDEVLVECRARQNLLVRDVVRDSMEHAFDSLLVPIKVKLSQGPNWGQLHPF